MVIIIIIMYGYSMVNIIIISGIMYSIYLSISSLLLSERNRYTYFDDDMHMKLGMIAISI